MSEKIEYVSIHVRLLREQYEWLRKYSYENRVPQAEVVRKVLDAYRNCKVSASCRECKKPAIRARLL